MLKKLHGRKLAVCLIGGAMYALFSAFGWQAEHGGVIWAGGALLVAALLVWPIAALLAVLLERGYTRALRREKTFRAGRAFAFILACYVPMFCVAFPGSFAYDVPYQLRQVVTGAYSTHHPLLHTLALGGLLQLGRALGDINLGAALYTALQMALLAGCFALTCGSIARQSGARAVRTLKQGGLSADKILLGIPAYGRMWRQVSGSAVTQTAGISGTKVLNFPDLLALESQGYTRYYDGAAKAAYWVGGENFVSGEDEQSIRDKAQWAVQQGLQGAAVWSYGQDASGKLLAWVKEALAQ